MDMIRLRWGSKSLGLNAGLPILLSSTIFISFLHILCSTLSSKKVRLSSASLFAMGAKDIIRTQTCVLTMEELSNFLTTYPIPSEYKVMLPKSNQTIFDALNGLNPFGCAKLTTFIVMCKGYGCEPPVELFRGFVNLFPGGKWLTFYKMHEKHIPNLLPKVITRIEAGLKPSWEYDQQRLVIIVVGKEMAFRNFLYAKTDEDLTFLHKDPSPEFGSSLIHQEKLVIHPGSVAKRIKDRKCRIRGGYSKLPVKCRLVQGASSSRATYQKNVSSKDDSPFLTISDNDEGLPDVIELQDANSCHLKIFAITPPVWRGHLDNQLDVELLDLHDRCYARQAVVDNAVNRRARELLKVVEQMKGECDVLKAREKARDKECEELKAKCEATMADFDNNLAVKVLREKIASLLLESKVASLEAENARFEAVEASLRQEVEDVKRDKAKVVLKVVPYIAMELVYSDELGMLAGKLVSSAVFYERCAAFEEVAEMKEPFDLNKVKGYRPSYKKEHIKDGNDLTTTTFPFLSEVVENPSASVKALLSKKPLTLQCPTPMRTHAPAPSSQKATPSYVLVSKPQSPSSV
ncbi:hypothetical protein Tco_0287680 [Tanacetum coccineum]